jgi:hypothetical protein
MFKTPILLIAFNRPDHTRQVFDAIKKQRPAHLFVFQDGARAGNERDAVNCPAVRAIVDESIDWTCDFHTFYSEKNLGCGKGPATGISWFFEHVEQGIIFEDDAVPAPDFFGYAEELLERYKNEDSIKVIGSMHLDGKQYGKGSYHFSMTNRSLCAWATWKRSWLTFDYYMKNITVKDVKRAFRHYHATFRETEYWCDRLEEIHTDRLGESSWDMQFIMSIWLNKGIGIFPNVNLSSNIGFDSEGTHTLSSQSAAANLKVDSILPLIHPSKIKICRKADLNYHKLYFQPMEYGLQGFKRWPYRMNKRIKSLFGVKGSWIPKNKKR